MRIIGIYPPYLYTVKYDGDDMNIYRLTYGKLTDDGYLSDFFKKFSPRISDFIVERIGIDRSETEEYAAEVNDQMIDIADELKNICNALRDGKIKDFGNCFSPHSKIDIRDLPDGGGRSIKYATGYLPVKCKGPSEPPLVRLYAIELSIRCYLIVYGGIKLQLDTNDSPDLDKDGNISNLERELKSRVLAVCRFLAEKGIINLEGLKEYLEEEE